MPLGVDYWLAGRLDYVMFLRTAFGFARMLRPDAIIGYDMRGVAAAYLSQSGQSWSEACVS